MIQLTNIKTKREKLCRTLGKNYVVLKGKTMSVSKTVFKKDCFKKDSTYSEASFRELFFKIFKVHLTT